MNVDGRLFAIAVLLLVTGGMVATGAVSPSVGDIFEDGDRIEDDQTGETTDIFLSPANTTQAQEYASLDSTTGELTLNLSDLNKQATTRVDDLFVVAYAGDQKARVGFRPGDALEPDENVTFLDMATDQPIASTSAELEPGVGDDAVVLQPGEDAVVGIEAETGTSQNLASSVEVLSDVAEGEFEIFEVSVDNVTGADPFVVRAGDTFEFNTTVLNNANNATADRLVNASSALFDTNVSQLVENVSPNEAVEVQLTEELAQQGLVGDTVDVNLEVIDPDDFGEGAVVEDEQTVQIAVSTAPEYEFTIPSGGTVAGLGFPAGVEESTYAEILDPGGPINVFEYDAPTEQFQQVNITQAGPDPLDAIVVTTDRFVGGATEVSFNVSEPVGTPANRTLGGGQLHFVPATVFDDADTAFGGAFDGDLVAAVDRFDRPDSSRLVQPGSFESQIGDERYVFGSGSPPVADPFRGYFLETNTSGTYGSAVGPVPTGDLLRFDVDDALNAVGFDDVFGSTEVTGQSTTVPRVDGSYYGNVSAAGQPAMTGFTIEAEIDGEVRGTIPVDPQGFYGGAPGPAAGEFLTVDADPGDAGKQVTFFVNGTDIPRTQAATVQYSEGDLRQVDLEAVYQRAQAILDQLSVAGQGANASIVAGDQRNIAVNVTNVGEAADSFDLELAVLDNGTPAFPNVTATSAKLGEGESEAVVFGVAPDVGALAPGEYDVVVSSDADQITGTLTVLEPAAGLLDTLDIADQGDTATLAAGEGGDIEANVTNAGEAADSFDLELAVLDNGTPVFPNVTVTSETLNGSENDTVAFGVENQLANLAPATTYDVVVTTGDDRIEGTLVVEEPGVPQLESLETPEPLFAGDDEPINVSVSNLGDGADEFNVTIEVQPPVDSNAGPIVENQTLPVGAGATETAVFEGITDQIGTVGFYQVTANVTGAGELVGEYIVSVDANNNGLPASDAPNGPARYDRQFDDVTGTGSFGIADVVALFRNFDRDVVQDNPRVFSFRDPDDPNPNEPGIVDVVELFRAL